MQKEQWGEYVAMHAHDVRPRQDGGGGAPPLVAPISFSVRGGKKLFVNERVKCL